MKIHIYLKLFLIGSFFACSSAENESFIAVNQVGYEAVHEKIALLVNADADSFQVINKINDTLVYSRPAGRVMQPDSATGDRVLVLDFSELTEPGEYFLKTIDEIPYQSDIFLIGENIYSDALLTTLKSYYYHRCGIDVGLDDEWSYKICHLDDAPFYNDHSTFRDVTGGWHDAGDYNKFSGNTALSASLLLYLFELQEELFTDGQLYIPESGNGMPDILDEVAWALDWLIKMQHHDGAVYHKVSQKQWIGEYLPDKDPSVRYLFETSTAATASFTATAALGARIFRNYNHIYSEKLEKAAIRGWNYLDKNPVNLPLGGFKNPPDVFGGEYGDSEDRDERLWASIELYKLTGDDMFLTYFQNSFKTQLERGFAPVSWRNAQNLAFHSYLLSNFAKGSYSEEGEIIKREFLDYANVLLEVQKQNNYLNLNRNTEYYWGSNSVGLAYAFDLIQAYRITEDQNYYRGALDQLHFILGRNPFNKSMVTGIGYRFVNHPYHQLSEMGGFEQAIPGMLVGGPNNYVLLNNRELSPYPAKNFQDTFKNFYVNEPAINFTAIFAYVVGFFSFTESNNSPYTVLK